ncbi:Yqey domain containing protein [Candidatus Nitrosoglobus terrae]|uniref:Yqey domain containing protein n=1 Tax=Candidatus Nitrosoglobus terrae TaxID=1630141 RepID=A0A1Q2SJU6_9GAMM|nr:GatB/YqeY domain-containing protein [Candidatus Nitrosoglobus terrae]BAW79398.1 Yqey domain containing protein [Candidatus Nitrosoglobus terrae]
MVAEVSLLKVRLQENVKNAMRVKDKAQLGTLRMIMAALKQVEVDTRESLNDAQIIILLDKMLKQRREAWEQFKAAGREDLAEKEYFEQQIIQNYMPDPLSKDEIEQLIDEAVEQFHAVSIKDMGKIMSALKPRIQGRADMIVVSAQIKVRLAGLSS